MCYTENREALDEFAVCLQNKLFIDNNCSAAQITMFNIMIKDLFVYADICSGITTMHVFEMPWERMP